MNLTVYNDKPKEDIKFTKSQERAVDELIEFIAAPWSNSDFVRCLCGPGGTGKTFVTKYVIRNCKFSDSVILCAAPTHKACRVLSKAIGGKKVNTIQSMLGLKLNLSLEDFDPERPQFDPLGEPKLEGNRVLIIDESSMLPAKLVNYLYDQCRNEQIKLIMLGDASQLAPVNERKSLAFAGNNIFYLTEIVRQENDNPISKLLLILRNDIRDRTYNFLEYIVRAPYAYDENNCGYITCGLTEFTKHIQQSFLDEAYTKNIDMYRIIAYTNAAVTNWNTYVRQNIIKDSEKSILTKNDLVMSYNTIVDDFNDIIIVNSDEYIINDIVDFVDPDYEFKGMMVKFQAIHGGKVTQPLFIINHFDSYTISRYYQTVNSLINAAKSATVGRNGKWKEYYKFKRKYLLATNIVNKQGKIILQRDIDYGFAITSHKSQGSTYDTVFVDINDMVYDKTGKPYDNADELLRRLYVACSRARKELIFCYGR